MNAELAFLIDMDGVIYRGDQVIPEAPAFMETIKAHPYLFVTNNSSVAPQQVLHKLQDVGLKDCRIEHILTSALATAGYLQDLKPGFSYYAVGGPGLHESLGAYGSADETDPDFVVIGEGEGLDYHTLTTGISILSRGRAKLIGTNPDISLDGTHEGKPAILPGGGTLIAPFQVATGIKPLFIGKPNALMYKQGLRRMKREPGETIMIGDRPDTDIRGAVEIGMRSILVCTGRFKRGDPYPPDVPKPDLMVDTLAELDLHTLRRLVEA